MEKKFTRNRTALKRGSRVHVWKSVTNVECHRCERRAESECKENDHGKRSIDCNFDLCLDGVENGRERGNPEINAVINILQ